MNKLIEVRKNEIGFTLIELILAISIIGIVISLSTGFMVDIFKIVVPSNERMNAKQIAEIRLTEISKYVRSASNIDKVDNKIIANGKTLKKDESKNSNRILIIKNSDNTVERSIPNIRDFNISDNDNDGVFEITIEVCRNNECNKWETASSEIVPRNTIP